MQQVAPESHIQASVACDTTEREVLATPAESREGVDALPVVLEMGLEVLEVAAVSPRPFPLPLPFPPPKLPLLPFVRWDSKRAIASACGQFLERWPGRLHVKQWEEEDAAFAVSMAED